MKRLYLALWLLGVSCAGIALPERALAVATTKVTLLATGWTDLGVGPLQLNSGGTQVLYAIADTLPPVPAQGFSLPTNVNQTVNTASHVWAIGAQPSGAFVIVAQVAGTSGSGGTFTWPGSATVTNYGVAPTGTVPAVNAFVTNGAGGSGNGWLSSKVFSTSTTITTTSTPIAFPAGFTTGSTIRVYNKGPSSVNWTYGPGTPVATPSMAQLPPYSNDSFVVAAGDTTFAGITQVSGQTAQINLELGSGNPNATGGPINQSVTGAGTTATFYTVSGGLDNGSLARAYGATAPGTAATTFIMPVQGCPTCVPIPVSGSATIADGADVAEGAQAATAWTGTGNATVISALKALWAKINQSLDATLNAQKVIPATNVTPGSCSTTTVSASAVNLPGLGTANVHGFHIVNKDGTTNGGEAIGVNFIGVAAFTGTGSSDTVLLAPPATAKDTGGSFTSSPGEGLNHAVSVIAPSGGHVIWCMWW